MRGQLQSGVILSLLLTFSFAFASPARLTISYDVLTLETSTEIHASQWNEIVKRRSDDPVFLGRMLLHWPKTIRAEFDKAVDTQLGNMTLGFHQMNSGQDEKHEIFVRIESSNAPANLNFVLKVNGRSQVSPFRRFSRPEDSGQSTRVLGASHQLGRSAPFAPLEISLKSGERVLARYSILLPYWNDEMSARTVVNETCEQLPFRGSLPANLTTARSVLAVNGSRPLWTSTNGREKVPALGPSAAVLQIDCYMSFGAGPLSIVLGKTKAIALR